MLTPRPAICRTVRPETDVADRLDLSSACRLQPRRSEIESAVSVAIWIRDRDRALHRAEAELVDELDGLRIYPLDDDARPPP